jgi:hypothetical protein
LIIAGVSLLFPSITTVTTRKRRNAAGKNTHTHTHNVIICTYTKYTLYKKC